MKTGIITLGELKLDSGELADFIVWAKKGAYASGTEYEPTGTDSRRFSCKKGNFFFRDEYIGDRQFSGHEVVRWRSEHGQPIWRMNYLGGMIPKFLDNKELTGQVENVLRAALMQVTPEAPFRGPKSFKHQGFLYQNNFHGGDMFHNGDIERFSGNEIIRGVGESKPQYSLDYHGGIIIK